MCDAHPRRLTHDGAACASNARLMPVLNQAERAVARPAAAFCSEVGLLVAQSKTRKAAYLIF